jgi:hypothetical protein
VTARGLTVSASGITVTGASTITGTLGGITTLTATTLAGTLSTATQNSVTTMTALVTVGALNAGSITSGFGSIDIGADGFTGGGFNTSFGTNNVASGGSATILSPSTSGAYLVYYDTAAGASTMLGWALFGYDGATVVRIGAGDGGNATSTTDGVSIKVNYLGGFGGTANIRWRIIRFGGASY